MARVSVIIPAFDPGTFLGEALESVHNQTFTDWEAVVVEDGGEQDTTSIVEQFPRVRLIRQSNFGASVARNRGLFATDGPLILFMDQDDLWSPDKLAHQVAVMDEFPDAGVCFSHLQVFRGSISEVDLGDRSDHSALDVVLDPDPDEEESACFLRAVRYFNSGFIIPSTTMP